MSNTSPTIPRPTPEKWATWTLTIRAEVPIVNSSCQLFVCMYDDSRLIQSKREFRVQMTHKL